MADSGAQNSARELLLLHFNDVYSISPRNKEPAGGPLNFASAVEGFRGKHPMTIFSGDFLNPSIISTVTQGQHMPDVLNALDVSVGTIGNHDLDFGVDNLRAAIKKCAFPWVLSNVTETATGTVLGGEDLVLTSHMVQWPSMHGNGSIAVGVMGLAEEDWLSCISAVPRSALQYTDFVQCANATAAKLRGDGAEVIIAVTHFRLPNDQRLAVEALDVDVILGGHDHMYYSDPAHGPRRVPVVKSGTDFQYLSELRLRLREDAPLTTGGGDVPSRMEVTLIKHAINGDMPEHPRMAAVVRSHQGVLRGLMAEVLGVVDVPLDTRFQVVRTMESNAGNWLADLMRVGLGADVALLNGGNIRSDALIGPGVFSKLHLIKMLPFPTQVCRVRVPPSALLAALEVSVSGLPAMSGGFLQVSGVRFDFDPSAPKGSRVDADSVLVHLPRSDVRGVALADDGDRQWVPLLSLPAGATVTAAIPDFMADGKEGFDMLKGGNGDTVIEVDGENGNSLQGLVTNYFLLARSVNAAWSATAPQYRHVLTRLRNWLGMVRARLALRRQAAAQRAIASPLQEDGEDGSDIQAGPLAAPVLPATVLQHGRVRRAARSTAADAGAVLRAPGLEAGLVRLAPVLQGRINMVSGHGGDSAGDDSHGALCDVYGRSMGGEQDGQRHTGAHVHGCAPGDVQAVVLAGYGQDAAAALHENHISRVRAQAGKGTAHAAGGSAAGGSAGGAPGATTDSAAGSAASGSLGAPKQPGSVDGVSSSAPWALLPAVAAAAVVGVAVGFAAARVWRHRA